VSRLGDNSVQPLVLRLAHLHAPESAASGAIVVRRATRLKHSRVQSRALMPARCDHGSRVDTKGREVSKFASLKDEV
jgi:hypothetical protein